MSSPYTANQPYNTDLEPALTPDATVELQPGTDTRIVDLVEVVPTVETQEVTVSGNSTNEEVEMRGLYLPENVLGQFRLTGGLPDNVRISIAQGGAESPRFSIKNQNGFIDSDTIAAGDANQQTELFQLHDTDLFFTFENTTSGDETFNLKYTGYAYKLSNIDIAADEADIQVPIERLNLR